MTTDVTATRARRPGLMPWVVAFALWPATAPLLAAQGPPLGVPGLSMTDPRVFAVSRVQDRHSRALMSLPGVVGTATGVDEEGQVVVTVLTEHPGVTGIPARLEGTPVRVEASGRFVALADPTARFVRPVPIGVSTGHYDITAGTIGCRVRDEGGDVYALSNNHVYANVNLASVGDPVIQPGRYDGGVDPDVDPVDVIGHLSEFVALVMGRKNLNTVDAAIAFSTIDELGFATPDGDGYVVPNRFTVGASLGQLVQKYGRTTAWTHGQITGINATVNVCYSDSSCGNNDIAVFVGQVLITGSGGSFSAGGDSGSLIVTDDGDRRPVALLFAGNSTQTIANPITLVLEAFVATGPLTIDDGGPVMDTGAIAASVTDGEGGPPVVGARVTVVDTGQFAFTDSNGECTLSGVPAGTHTVTASFDWYQQGSLEVEVTADGTVDAVFALNPLPTGTVTGVVRDTTGTGITGASVTADSGQSTTTVDGSYTLTEVPEGERRITAAAAGHASETKPTTVNGDAPVSLDFLLHPAIVVPNEFEDLEAPGSSGSLASILTLQEVYAARHFGSPPAPVTISGMRFRLDNPAAASSASSLPQLTPTASTNELVTGTSPLPDFSADSQTVDAVNLRIMLSTTSRNPGDLDLLFANNLGEDAIVVHDGLVNLHASGGALPGEDNPFELVIDFTDSEGNPLSFDYDPALGNLLVEIRNYSGSSLGSIDASNTSGDDASRVFALNANATLATAADTGADVIQFLLNQRPTAGDDTLERHPTQAAKVAVAHLLANDSDLDSDLLEIASVEANAANGAAVELAGDWVFYDPKGFTGDDTFTYTITDGKGGTALGTVSVQAKVPDTTAQNVVATIELDPETHRVRIDFMGLPGRTYTIQYKASLGDAWSPTGVTATADAQGRFSYEAEPFDSQGYYRSAYLP